MTAVPTVPPPVVQIDPDIIKEIALDIGKEVAAHIEIMYPAAVQATSKTFLLSVRNCVYNQIMASLEVIDEDQIRERLAARRKWRRQHKALYRNVRARRG